MTVAADAWRRDQAGCTPCVAQLNSPAERLSALLTVIALETEPIVTLTHLRQLCRDEHVVLRERVNDPGYQDRVAQTLFGLNEHIGAARSGVEAHGTTRRTWRRAARVGVRAVPQPESVAATDAPTTLNRPNWSSTEIRSQPCIGIGTTIGQDGAGR